MLSPIYPGFAREFQSSPTGFSPLSLHNLQSCHQTRILAKMAVHSEINWKKHYKNYLQGDNFPVVAPECLDIFQRFLALAPQTKKNRCGARMSRHPLTVSDVGATCIKPAILSKLFEKKGRSKLEFYWKVGRSDNSHALIPLVSWQQEKNLSIINKKVFKRPEKSI